MASQDAPPIAGLGPRVGKRLGFPGSARGRRCSNKPRAGVRAIFQPIDRYPRFRGWVRSQAGRGIPTTGTTTTRGLVTLWHQHEAFQLKEGAWLCESCKDEVWVRRNQCPNCHGWRPKHGPLVNLGKDAEELSVRLPLSWFSTGERWSMAAQVWLCVAVANAAYTTTAPKSCSPGDFMQAESSRHPALDPAPKKARGPWEEDRPVAIIIPTGEALWFTTRDLSESKPQDWLFPWSVFQHLVMSRRLLCWGKVGVIVIRRVAQDILHWAHSKGYMTRILEANASNPCFMDLGSVHPEPHGGQPPVSSATGSLRGCFTYQDYLRNPSLGQHCRETKAHREQVVPLFRASSQNLCTACPWLQLTKTPTRQATLWVYGRLSCWAKRGPCRLIPASTTPGPGRLNGGGESGGGPDRARVLRAGKEDEGPELQPTKSSFGEHGQHLQRSHAPSGVPPSFVGRGKGVPPKPRLRKTVKATQASANNDPKYVEDLDRGVGHVAAFQRHRSRLRAIQHQVEHGKVSLQPRATPLQTVRTLPPMMSLGRAHRL